MWRGGEQNVWTPRGREKRKKSRFEEFLLNHLDHMAHRQEEKVSYGSLFTHI